MFRDWRRELAADETRQLVLTMQILGIRHLEVVR